MFWSNKSADKEAAETRITDEAVSRSLNLQSEPARLRLFVSHRYGRDDDFHRRVVDSRRLSEACGCHIEDMSVTVDRMFQGPRGGQLHELQVRAGLIRAIADCDVFVIESKQKRAQTEWVSWELEIAALALNKPVLFVDHREDLANPTDAIDELNKVGARVYRCGPTEEELAAAVSGILVDIGFVRPLTVAAE